MVLDDRTISRGWQVSDVPARLTSFETYCVQGELMKSWALPAATTAVVVVDMQNDNVHADGAFASSGAAEHAVAQNVIGNVRTVLDTARAIGVPVFHNRIVVYPQRPVGGENAAIFRMLGPESLKVGTWGAEIVDGLDVRDDEIVLDRMRMSAFHGTSLDAMLRNLGVSDVIVVGVWTNMAVEHTVRDAADLGYRVAIVSDATSSVNAEWQHAALNYALTNIATITDTASVTAALRDRA
jgi:nicotinamidase-related amidase